MPVIEYMRHSVWEGGIWKGKEAVATPCHETLSRSPSTLQLTRTSLEHGLGANLGAPPPHREALVLVVKDPQSIVPKLLGGVLLLHLVACPLQHNGKNKIQQHRL